MPRIVGPLVSKPDFIKAEISGETIRNYERYEKLAARIEILEREREIFVKNHTRLEVIAEQQSRELAALKQEVALLRTGRMERKEKTASAQGSKELPMMWERGIGALIDRNIDVYCIEVIIFLDSLEKAPEDASDISDAGNCSVLAWQEDRYHTKILYIAGEGGVKANQNCTGMFAWCRSLRSVGFGDNFYTSGVTNMEGMFRGCISLKKIDLTGFDTSSVTSMERMFEECRSLEKIDVTGFDTSSVTSMKEMFGVCKNLRILDVTGFDTSSVTSMEGMFEQCESLEKIDVTGFDTSNVINMKYMFCSCWNLEEINVTGFHVVNEEARIGMFKDTMWEAEPPL